MVGFEHIKQVFKCINCGRTHSSYWLRSECCCKNIKEGIRLAVEHQRKQNGNL